LMYSTLDKRVGGFSPLWIQLGVTLLYTSHSLKESKPTAADDLDRQGARGRGLRPSRGSSVAWRPLCHYRETFKEYQLIERCSRICHAMTCPEA
jgi:hypothetical protein